MLFGKQSVWVRAPPGARLLLQPELQLEFDCIIATTQPTVTIETATTETTEDIDTIKLKASLFLDMSQLHKYDSATSRALPGALSFESRAGVHATSFCNVRHNTLQRVSTERVRLKAPAQNVE